MDGVGHIDLGSLPGDKVLLRAGLAGHLVDQGNALGLGSKDVVIAVGGNQLQQLPGAGHSQLRVAEADERADVQVVRDPADGQFPFQAGNFHGISKHRMRLP